MITTYQPRLCYLLAALMIPLTFAAMPWDMEIARYLLKNDVPSLLRATLTISEIMAHGIGTIIILFAVGLLIPGGYRLVPRLGLSALGAGLLANLGKLMVIRVRPELITKKMTVQDTFLGWFPILEEGGLAMDRTMRSFPSGHTAAAVGLTVILVCFFPRGRWLFLVMGIFAAMQRVEADAHFLSDTFAGAAIGFLVAGLCLEPRLPLPKLFSRWERPVLESLQRHEENYALQMAKPSPTDQKRAA
jgi:membrane-associated phospholipid phosphatase